jgi:Tfp pilus assembly protein PilZ
MEKTLENRRKVPRKPLVGMLDIYSRDESANLGKGFVTNLNETGLKLVSQENFKLGQELLLHFNLQNGWKFDFAGKVVYQEEAVSAVAYGIEFLAGQGTFILRLI